MDQEQFSRLEQKITALITAHEELKQEYNTLKAQQKELTVKNQQVTARIATLIQRLKSLEPHL